VVDGTTVALVQVVAVAVVAATTTAPTVVEQDEEAEVVDEAAAAAAELASEMSTPMIISEIPRAMHHSYPMKPCPLLRNYWRRDWIVVNEECSTKRMAYVMSC
jgi:hypothetical protein